MTDRFLKAKHWQIFLLTFGIPLIFQFIMMGSMISKFATREDADPAMMFNYLKLYPLIMILFMALLFGWLWSIATGLQRKVPENVTMKVKKFKILFLIPMVYMLLFLTFFSLIMNVLISADSEPSFGLIGGLFAVIFPLHLLAMFCILYSLYFVAKTYKTVELQREVSFGDFAGEFFLVWFYPVGIWILQPKINKMVEE